MKTFVKLIFLIWLIGEIENNPLTKYSFDSDEDYIPNYDDMYPSDDPIPNYDGEHDHEDEEDEEGGFGRCHCGVFTRELPLHSDKPILVDTSTRTHCDAKGRIECVEICSALGKSAGNRRMEIICAALGTYQDLTVSIHSRVCKNDYWRYTGITSPYPICCSQKKIVTCTKE